MSFNLSQKRRGPYLAKLTCLIVIIIFVHGNSSAQSTAFRLTGGIFSPQDWAVKGRAGNVEGAIFDYIRSPGNIGFGDAWEGGFSCERYLGRLGLRIELGMREHKNKGEYRGFNDYLQYKTRLDVYWMEWALICRLTDNDMRFSPFIGFGPGLYVIEMRQETRRIFFDYIEDKRGSSTAAVGFRFITGFDYRLFGGFFLTGELSYGFIQRDFELENPDSGNISRIYDLNIGGTSMRFGVGYEF